MAQELVWARIGDHCAAVSRAEAVANGYEVLDEPVRDRSGAVRRATRANGRPVKPRTRIAKATAKKAAKKTAKKSAAKKTSAAPDAAGEKAAEVIAEPASDTDSKE